jgi:hypothetical protein
VKEKVVDIAVNSFKPLKKAGKPSVADATDRYGQFPGLPVEVR